MRIGQLLPGVLLTLLGIVLLVVSAFSSFQGGGIVALIYGVIALVIGVVILANQEDHIEGIHVSQKRKGGRTHAT